MLWGGTQGPHEALGQITLPYGLCEFDTEARTCPKVDVVWSKVKTQVERERYPLRIALA